MRLIDADLFKEKFSGQYEFMKRVIDDEPTVKAVEVVRCKDCKHMKIHSDRNYCDVWCAYLPLDYFCKDGDKNE